MEIVRHPNTNKVFGETQDEYQDLPVVTYDGVDGHSMQSFWKPSPEELAALVAGGAVCLRVLGYSHPPVFVGAVEKWDVDDPETGG